MTDCKMPMSLQRPCSPDCCVAPRHSDGPAGFEHCVQRLSLQLNAAARAVKTESTLEEGACCLAPRVRSHRPLKWRTGSAILEPLSVSIVLTQPSCRLVVEPCMKSRAFGHGPCGRYPPLK